MDTGSRILALDVGDRRIGMAVSDPSGMLATPLGVYRRTELAHDLDHIETVARDEETRLVVLGLPRNMNGSEGPQAEKTRVFGRALAGRGITVDYWDERLTTVEATRMLQERGLKRKRIEAVVDELAATLILEGYLLGRERAQ